MENSIGIRFKAVRKKLGLTQESLAKKVKVSHPTINRIEKGQMPSEQTLELLMLLFGVSRDYILNGQGNIFRKDDDLNSVSKTTFIYAEKDEKAELWERLAKERNDVIDLLKDKVQYLEEAISRLKQDQVAS